MAKKEPAVCDECGSLFFKGSSQMMGLCPECAHILYGYPNCPHHFQNGRCVNCYWDGSKSGYIKELNQQEEADMPTTEWLNKYESTKDKLACKADLEAHFTEKLIGNMAVDVLDIGPVHFPTGQIFACDPLEEDPDIDPYNDLFCDLMEENAKAHPKYQESHGDWLNWTIPGTDCNLPVFSSGWGDGYYPVYFGYDAKGEICAVYVRFIDIEACYKEQA